MYERYDQPLAPRHVFWRRVGRQIVIATGPLVVSLAIGWIGYMVLANLGPVDAFLNAAMILGGMGPVDALPTDAAKIFAGIYAIYSGVVFLVIAGLVLAPFLHRVLHVLHVADDEETPDSPQEPN